MKMLAIVLLVLWTVVFVIMFVELVLYHLKKKGYFPYRGERRLNGPEEFFCPGAIYRKDTPVVIYKNGEPVSAYYKRDEPAVIIDDEKMPEWLSVPCEDYKRGEPAFIIDDEKMPEWWSVPSEDYKRGAPAAVYNEASALKDLEWWFKAPMLEPAIVTYDKSGKPETYKLEEKGMDVIMIYGVMDPEMEAIKTMAVQAAVPFAPAAFHGRKARTSEEVYSCDDVPPEMGPSRPRVIWVECRPKNGVVEGDVVFDHHAPEDPGYGRPPKEFLAASSLGQFISFLAKMDYLPPHWETHPGECLLPGQFSRFMMPGRPSEFWVVGGASEEMESVLAYEVPEELVLCAAADHCLPAAFKGECPGVDPAALARWRAESRAAFQRVPVEEILEAVEAAKQEILAAPSVEIAPGFWVCDFLDRHVRELPEAAAQLGRCFISSGLPDASGDIKTVLQSGSEAEVKMFMEVWAPAHGLVRIYGDPARGFAGGYTSKK